MVYSSSSQQHMTSRLVQALTGTEHLNTGLQCIGGQVFHQQQPLKPYQEGLQLYFKTTGCKLGVQHYRLLTPNSVSKGAKLACAICLQQEVYGTEQYMTQLLQLYGFDQQFVLQWQPSWWHGRVDYYFPTRGVVMQVDGSAHFVANPRARQLAQLLATDLQCNMQAWQHGAKLIRVHHADQDCLAWAVQLAAMSLVTGPVLVLSPSYTYVKWKQLSGDPACVGYVAYMQSQIAGCKCMSTSDGYLWLTM